MLFDTAITLDSRHEVLPTGLLPKGQSFVFGGHTDHCRNDNFPWPHSRNLDKYAWLRMLVQKPVYLVAATFWNSFHLNVYLYYTP